MTPLLELRGVTVVVGTRRILDVPGLSVAVGETVAVLGANGAGKSTLLRVAGALRRPTAGEVRLDGRSAGEAEMRRAIAGVLQRPLLRRGSVRMNVMTGLRMRGHGRRAAAVAAQPWLERLGLAELAKQSAGSLSGGEAQRVSLARAFAVAPRLLLLDEPFTALDAPTRGQLLADLRHLLRETGTAALFVTHDRHEAVGISDRLAILERGSLRQLGPATEVVDQPADLGCARLLGYDTTLPGDTGALVGEGQQVVIRPRELQLRTGPLWPVGFGEVEVRVVRLITLGPDTRIEAVASDGTPLTAIVPTDIAVRVGGLGEGMSVTLGFDARSFRVVRER